MAYAMLILYLALLSTAVGGRPVNLLFHGPLSQAAQTFSKAEISKLQTQAEAGDAVAQRTLAEAYDHGKGVTQNRAIAAKWYRKAADQGDPAAENSLGILYMVGEGVERNKETAVEWYRKAAHQGNGSAMYNLGTAYYNGDGVNIDDTDAYAWFLLAQEAGSEPAKEAVTREEAEGKSFRVNAFARVAAMYEQGDEVPQNRAGAVKWYRRASDEGDNQSSIKLAGLLTERAPTAPDYAEALERCKAAAKRNYPAAYTCVGVFYQRGLGIPAETKEAIKWFTRGAEWGNGRAMVLLGDMYWKGQGVPADKTTAYMWLWMAATSRLPDAIQKESELKSQLSQTEIEAAQKLGREWTRKHRVLGLIDRPPRIQ